MFNDGNVFVVLRGVPKDPQARQHPLEDRGSTWPPGAGLGAPTAARVLPT